MCFRFGSCFGSGGGQDYGRSASKATHHGYASGADHHKSGPQAYHPVAGHETHRNAHDYAQGKADDTLKHAAAWSSKVGEERLQEDAATAIADPREHAAVDHHHYPTTIATTTARY